MFTQTVALFGALAALANAAPVFVAPISPIFLANGTLLANGTAVELPANGTYAGNATLAENGTIFATPNGTVLAENITEVANTTFNYLSVPNATVFANASVLNGSLDSGVVVDAEEEETSFTAPVPTWTQQVASASAAPSEPAATSEAAASVAASSAAPSVEASAAPSVEASSAAPSPAATSVEASASVAAPSPAAASEAAPSVSVQAVKAAAVAASSEVPVVAASSEAPAATSEAPAPEPSTEAPAPAPTTSTEEAQPQTTQQAQQASGGSNSGTATYYAVGLGACGGTNSDSELVVAMNAPQYSSSVCGKQVRITDNTTGNVRTATVVDLCPGCAHGSLDMSPTLFSQLSNGNMDQGVFPISWDFV